MSGFSPNTVILHWTLIVEKDYNQNAMWATFKSTMVFHFTGWLIGILITAYYNPQDNWAAFHPLYIYHILYITYITQGPTGHCSWFAKKLYPSRLHLFRSHRNHHSKPRCQWWFQGIPIMGPRYGKRDPYHSDIFRDSYGNSMGSSP